MMKRDKKRERKVSGKQAKCSAVKKEEMKKYHESPHARDEKVKKRKEKKDAVNRTQNPTTAVSTYSSCG